MRKSPIRIKQIKALISLSYLSDTTLCLIYLSISEIKFQSEVLFTEHMLTFLFKLTTERKASWFGWLVWWLNGFAKSYTLDIFHKMNELNLQLQDSDENIKYIIRDKHFIKKSCIGKCMLKLTIFNFPNPFQLNWIKSHASKKRKSIILLW